MNIMPLKLSVVKDTNFMWDGSDLGSYPDDIIVYEDAHDNVKYWKITIGNRTEVCMYRKYTNMFPCVVDELKPFFGLTKNGTHKIKIGSTRYIITRLHQDADGDPIFGRPLSKILPDDPLRMDDYISQEIRKILAFRELLAISSSYESNIWLHPTGATYQPISVREINSKLDKGQDVSVVTSGIIKKWFSKISLSQTIKQLVNYHGDPSECLVRTRKDVDKVISRVDENYIMYSNFIQDRLTRRLLDI
jgi:hypothetical protein